jgi:2-iminobutanoate/2-iminopropanoate deaminase
MNEQNVLIMGYDGSGAINRLAPIVKKQGLNMVMATVFLADLDDYPAVNEVYATYFTNDPPARQAVAISTIPGNTSVDISAIAMKSSN